MPIAITETVIISEGSCSQMLATLARISRITPTNRNLPRPEKSRLLTVATVAIVAKTAAVPPNAYMISAGPFENCSTEPMIRDSIRPMKNVKASSSTTPMALFLVFSIAKKKPKAIARNRISDRPGLAAMKLKPVATPIQAPSTVGTIDSASSQ
ncbi:hypothetical protein OJJOAM_003017 [Cupriavidus sp. H18C1]